MGGSGRPPGGCLAAGPLEPEQNKGDQATTHGNLMLEELGRDERVVAGDALVVKAGSSEGGHGGQDRFRRRRQEEEAVRAVGRR